MADYRPILERLIGFATVSSDSNLDCIDYIEDFLSKLGCRTRRYPDADNTKANLIARLGPDTGGGIMLAGHTDVVPVDGQDWHTDPFHLIERDGRYHGRGVADMKGFLALAMAAAAAVDPDRLRKPLYLAFTYDEETGCLGAKRLMEDMRSLDPRPSFVLIGEPTDMDIVTAHKGICISTTRVRGVPAHACRPRQGASAIAAAVRIIQRLDGILPDERDEAFDPPAATCNVGTIRGGNATNIIAADCTFEWELRPLPHQDVSAVMEAYRGLAAALEREIPGIKVENHVDARVPGLQDHMNRGIAARLQAMAGDAGLSTAAFTTEAGLFQQYGIPAVVCGPGHVNQAHQPDECVSIEKMSACRDLLTTAVEHYTVK